MSLAIPTSTYEVENILLGPVRNQYEALRIKSKVANYVAITTSFNQEWNDEILLVPMTGAMIGNLFEKRANDNKPVDLKLARISLLTLPFVERINLSDDGSCMIYTNALYSVNHFKTIVRVVDRVFRDLNKSNT